MAKRLPKSVSTSRKEDITKEDLAFIEAEIYREAEVIFTTASSAQKIDLKNFFFHRAVIDEAGLETDEMFLGILTKRCCNFVACGDPNQLPPTCDEFAKTYSLDVAIYNVTCEAAAKHRDELQGSISVILDVQFRTNVCQVRFLKIKCGLTAFSRQSCGSRQSG